MRISDWSSDVCSSDLAQGSGVVNSDTDQRQDDGDPWPRRGAAVGGGRVQETHSPTTCGSATCCWWRSGAARLAVAVRSSPGGSPLPTCAVSSWSRTRTAVVRTRSAVDWMTSTGSLPGTLLAQLDTYGIV